VLPNGEAPSFITPQKNFFKILRLTAMVTTPTAPLALGSLKYQED
ncbi:hypothetical protein ABIC84_005119, partial [Mucilaginibacter sp. 3215]